MKKEREFLHLKKFLELLPDFENMDVEFSESPDFILQGRDRKIGVEHTELFQPNDSALLPLQAKESLWERVINKACVLYERDHKQPLIVSILFNERREFKKQKLTV